MNEKQLEQTVIQKGLTAPRVTLDQLNANIVHTEIVKHITASGSILRWAVLTTACGYSATGRPSASVSVENDNAEIGESVAVDNARAELWPLMGYELKSRLHAQAQLVGNIAHLPPHQQRVIVERAELDDKLAKLSGFLSTELFGTLSPEEQERLTVQRGAMTEYLSILDDRISAFEVNQ